MLVVRASDGAAFLLYSTDLAGVQTLADLRTTLLGPLLAIPPDRIIAMSSTGSQLREDSVGVLAAEAGQPPAGASSRDKHEPVNGTLGLAHGDGAGDGQQQEEHKRIYVFDRAHLELELESGAADDLLIADDQALPPPLFEAPEPGDFLQSASQSLSTIHAFLDSLSLQRASLGAAMSNLERYVASNSSSLSTLTSSSAADFDKWAVLLSEWEGLMDACARVGIVQGFLVKGHARAGSTSITAGEEKQRFMGDFVNRDKMRSIQEGCARTLNDLQSRLELYSLRLAEVTAGQEGLHAEFGETSLADLVACEADAAQLHARVDEIVGTLIELQDPISEEEMDTIYDELFHLDAELRAQIAFLVERKNAMSIYVLRTMQSISGLQSGIAALPVELQALETDWKGRTAGFTHLERLKGLIPAYVATVVEIVRRREFTRLLSAHSSRLSDTLTPFISSESALRHSYRTQHNGKLPWEIKGLGGGTEEGFIDFEVQDKSGVDGLPGLGKDAITALRKSLDDILQSVTGPDGAAKPVNEAKELLEELVGDLDKAEKSFERLSATEGSTSDSATRATISDLEARLQAAEEARDTAERQLQSERATREDEAAKLNLKNGELEASRLRHEQEAKQLRDQVSTHGGRELSWTREKDSLERQKKSWDREKEESKSLLDELVRRANGAEGTVRKQDAALEDTERKLKALQAAMTEKERQYSSLERELAQLNEAHSSVTRKLASAERDHSHRSSEFETTHKELSTAIAEKDRQLRDHRQESEMDRAVFEQERSSFEAALKAKDEEISTRAAEAAEVERELAVLKVAAARHEEVARGWSEKATVAQSELDAARASTERAATESKEALDTIDKKARQAIKSALLLQTEYDMILAATMAAKQVKTKSSTVNLADKMVPPSTPPPPVPATATSSTSTPTEPTTYDTDNDDLDALIGRIKAYTANTLADAVHERSTGYVNVARKWQKEAKRYAERAHKAEDKAAQKIAFRNFAKGDLALFLPTRNTTAQIWAAFNVSFPHHFLDPDEAMSEQIKSREWIVARITSITEKIVDAKDPSSNPFSLAAGTKFFLLKVEGWNAKEHTGSRIRKHSTAADKVKKSDEVKRPTASREPSTLEASTSVPPQTPALPLSETPVGSPSRAEEARKDRSSDEDGALRSTASSPVHIEAPVEGLAAPTAAPKRAVSGLSLSLARNTPPTTPAAVKKELEEDDPFSSPFAGPSSSLAISSSAADEVQSFRSSSPTSTTFEPTLTAVGAFPGPAFLSSRAKQQSNKKLATVSEDGKPSAVAGPSSAQPIAAAHSPTNSSSRGQSTRDGFPRSASSTGSFLSASMYRRGTGSLLVGSPSTKGFATTSTSTQDFPNPDARPGASSTMTIGRTFTPSSPSVSEASSSKAAAPAPNKSLFATLGRRASQQSSSDTSGWSHLGSTQYPAEGASEILRRLKGNTRAA